jgi:hypothetical protein
VREKARDLLSSECVALTPFTVTRCGGIATAYVKAVFFAVIEYASDSSDMGQTVPECIEYFGTGIWPPRGMIMLKDKPDLAGR